MLIEVSSDTELLWCQTPSCLAFRFLVTLVVTARLTWSLGALPSLA